MEYSDEYYKMKYLKYKAKYQEALSRQKGGKSFAAAPQAGPPANIGQNVINPTISANLQGDNQTSLLMLAAIQNNQEIITNLIAARANLDLQDNDGNTALMHSIDKMNAGIALDLISSGANVTIQNRLFKTAKDIALNRGFTDIASIIREKEGIY